MSAHISKYWTTLIAYHGDEIATRLIDRFERYPTEAEMICELADELEPDIRLARNVVLDVETRSPERQAMLESLVSEPLPESYWEQIDALGEADPELEDVYYHGIAPDLERIYADAYEEQTELAFALAEPAQLSAATQRWREFLVLGLIALGFILAWILR